LVNAFNQYDEQPAANRTDSQPIFKLSLGIVSGKFFARFHGTDILRFLKHETKGPDEMSSKVANLIAIELGVLIAVLAWLAFSNLQIVKPQLIAQQPVRTVDSFATVASGLKSANPRPPVVDYRAGSPAEEEQEPAQTVQAYEQPTANEPYPNSSLDDGYVTETVPSYTVFDPPDRLLDSPDCLFSPVDPFFVYPQTTAIIVFSNPRSLGRHPRSTPRLGGAGTMVAHRPPPMTVTRRPPPQAPPPMRGGGVGQRRNTPVQSSRPSPRIRPRQIPWSRCDERPATGTLGLCLNDPTRPGKSKISVDMVASNRLKSRLITSPDVSTNLLFGLN
jgi:hypothetical protein